MKWEFSEKKRFKTNRNSFIILQFSNHNQNQIKSKCTPWLHLQGEYLTCTYIFFMNSWVKKNKNFCIIFSDSTQLKRCRLLKYMIYLKFQLYLTNDFFKWNDFGNIAYRDEPFTNIKFNQNPPETYFWLPHLINIQNFKEPNYW